MTFSCNSCGLNLNLLWRNLTHFHTISLETWSRSKWGQDPRWGTGQKVLWGEEQERWAAEWKKVRTVFPLTFSLTSYLVCISSIAFRLIFKWVITASCIKVELFTLSLSLYAVSIWQPLSSSQSIVCFECHLAFSVLLNNEVYLNNASVARHFCVFTSRVDEIYFKLELH